MIHVSREETDPLSVRVSAGWVRETKGGYVVYRGTLEEAIDCARRVLAALEAVQVENQKDRKSLK